MATFFMFGKYSSEALKGISAERTEKAMEIFKTDLPLSQTGILLGNA